MERLAADGHVRISADGKLDTPVEWLDRDGAAWRVSSRWELVGGRVEPVEVTIEAPPGRSLTGEIIRRIPLGSIFAERRREMASHLRLFAGAVRESDSADEGFSDRMEELASMLEAKRRPAWDDAHLRLVADVYRASWIEGGNPTSEVAAKFEVSRSTASKLVRASRARGFLGPAAPGRPGEEIPSQ